MLIGTWGEEAKLVLDMERKQVKILSKEEIMEDQYRIPFFPWEINSFVKIRRVSVFSPNGWIYVIYSKRQLQEISRKLSNHGYPFEPNMPLLMKIFEYLKKAKEAREARDLVVAVLENLPILAQM